MKDQNLLEIVTRVRNHYAAGNGLGIGKGDYCVYRSDTGDRCAVGCLLDEDKVTRINCMPHGYHKFNTFWDAKLSIAMLNSSDCVDQKNLLKVILKEVGLRADQGEALEHLQFLHDRTTGFWWHERLHDAQDKWSAELRERFRINLVTVLTGVIEETPATQLGVPWAQCADRKDYLFAYETLQSLIHSA